MCRRAPGCARADATTMHRRGCARVVATTMCRRGCARVVATTIHRNRNLVCISKKMRMTI